MNATIARAGWVIAMTDVAGVQHYLGEDAVARGRRTGCYVAVCGRAIFAASLTAPDGAVCASCRVRVGPR